MDDRRLPKQLLHAELTAGDHHVGGQRKRYKDVLKSTLKACNIPLGKWQAMAQDRTAWRAATRKGTENFEKTRLQSLDQKRLAKKAEVQIRALPHPARCAERPALLLLGFGPTCAVIGTDTSTSTMNDSHSSH